KCAIYYHLSPQGTKDGNVQCRRKGNPAPTPGSDKCKDLKTLLTYLGVPFVQAPSEAEATCAHLVVKELAWGAVTEDMDALPFNCPRLIRNLKAKKKTKAQEYNLPEILKRLHLSREQFVDLCILLGCDYTGKIRHVGKKKALTLIQQNQNMEGILQVIKPKDRIPSDFDYITARRLFLSPDVADVHHEDLKWAKPDDEKILQFLSREKHIKEHRVRNTLQKLHATRTPNLKKRKSKTTEAPAHKLTKITEFFPVRKSARPDKSTPGTHQTS
ncbi:flap endonuclease 1-like, partial [Rhinoderma darwinii]|uniref:flap endonuclease 1-like n=1 Tax=Rhinoderma darwinii TaxID=43563 RepID=UPI003F680EF4